MASSGGKPSQRSVPKQSSMAADPWCLTCGVNLAMDGRTFTVLSRHHTSELCDIFSRVLGAELSEEYASVNVCNRCERQLRRLGRYNSIILARHEGQKLRDQLEKNLSKYGQTVVESGDIEDLPSSEATTASDDASASVSSSVSGRKSQSLERKTSTVKRGELSSRSSSVSSVGSVQSRSSIDEGVELGGRGAGTRKYSAPAGNHRKLSPFSEGEKRREARRRKWSNASSNSEDNVPLSPTSTADRKLSSESRGVALSSLQHRSAAFRDAYLSSQKPKSGDQRKKSSDLTEVSPSAEQPSPNSPGGLTLDDFIGDDADMATSNDKKTLLEKSESLEQSNRRDKFKKRKFFSLGFLSSKSSGSKAQTNDKTPEETTKTVVGGEGEEASKVTTDENQGGGEKAESPTYWSERVNPFDEEEQKKKAQESFDNMESFDDDVFVKGIIDLDDPEARKNSVPRMDSLQADQELMAKLEGTKFKASPRHSSSSDGSFMDASEYNAERGSSLSEVEERITIKSQFKGAYYNIGSTEDLLQEFGSENDREKCKITFTESVDYGDTDASTETSKEDRSSGGPSVTTAQEDKKATGKTGGQEQDNKPLINEGESENKENEEDENMPFGFSRKKATKAEAKVESSVPVDEVTSNKDDATKETDDAGQKSDGLQNGDVSGDTDKKTDENSLSNDVADNKADGEVKVNGVIPEVPPEPLTKIEASKVDGKPVVTFAAEPEKDGSQPTQGDDGALTEKSEKSRLIDKTESGESTFKDQQPGFLCCVIL